MRFSLRDYQQDGVDDAVAQITDGVRATCYAAPTGSGKSVVELAAQAALRDAGRDAWIVTPRVEIVAGMLDKLGVEGAASLSTAKLVAEALRHGITTPIRLRNMLEKGELAALPDVLIIDEVHHSTAPSYVDLRLALGRCQLLGYTATPFRGTPRGTQEFVATWGEPVWLLTLPDAVKRGVIACPSFRVVPLLDDDELTIVNGEFKVASVADATHSRLDALADLVAANHGDRPTMVSVGSTELVTQLCDALARRNVAAVPVVQVSTQQQRADAFRRCLACDAVLVQIDVVSEGVDLPIRRLIDARPTLSPVKWMQQLGRITRPGGESAYLCTNRNAERHLYLWSGAIPPTALKTALSAFATPSMRSMSVRVVGLEKLGKFRPVELPLADGMKGALYGFQHVEASGVVREFAAILHPASMTPVYACRVRGNAVEGYGRWELIDAIPDLDGATARSMGNGRLSDKQQQWWRRSANHFGLDGSAEVNAKAFQVLPILADCKVRLVSL